MGYNEYDDEEQVSNNFFVNFYYNNKILVWIFGIIILFIILVMLLSKGGNNKKVVILHDVKIYPEGDVYVNIGKSANLTATVENDPRAVVTWSVDNNDIVKVDNGNVVGLDYGKAVVTATYIDSDDKKYSDSKNIIVADGDPNIPLTDVTFKQGDLYMPINSTYQIALVLSPTRGYVENETFTSSNTSVVTVDNKGNVTSVGEGHAVITFNVNNGSFKKELYVYVDSAFTKTEIVVTPEKIELDGQMRKIKVGSSERLTYTVGPNNADVSRLIWKSSDDTVVKVEDGVITGIQPGRASITVSALNGETDRIDVEVENNIIEVKSIDLSSNSLSLKVGDSKTIKPVVNPSDASNKALTYTSMDNSIARVDTNSTGTAATITAVKKGTTTILIESNNRVKTTVKVSVTDPNNQITPTPYNSTNYGSGTSYGSNGGSTSSIKGFNISSRDSSGTGQGFITDSYSAGKNSNNGAIAPVTITVEKTDSSVYKLVILVCYYSSSYVCGGEGRYTTTGNYSFVLRNTGEYVIRVQEYDSNNNMTRSTDRYIWVKSVAGGSENNSNATVSYTTSKALYSDEMSARTHPYAAGTTIKFSVANGSLKLCWGEVIAGKRCVPSLAVTTYKNVTFTTKGLLQIGISKYESGSSTAKETVYKYIYIS